MKFTPHLWAKVERDNPRPIFVLAMTNVHGLLRIDLPRIVTVDRRQQAIRAHYARWEKGLPCFGLILGYYHHYELGRYVEYDVAGNLIGPYDQVPMHYGESATLEFIPD